MRDEKPIWRADDRLSQTTQTAWERSRNNIRSQQVHDRKWEIPEILCCSLDEFKAYAMCEGECFGFSFLGF
jgi:hypothetical protein